MRDKGFVNGNSMRRNVTKGAINGLTNGKGNKDGLVNGNGTTNGKNNKGLMSSPKGRFGAWIVVGVVLLLIFGAFAISSNSFKKTDWNTITKYIDYDMNPIADKNINIQKFAFHLRNHQLEFYIQFEGDFAKTGEYQNLGFILIDNDTNPNTGYDTGYIGADYMVMLSGNNGTITASFEKFSGSGPYEWNWTETSGVVISKDGSNTITGMVNNHPISSNAEIMIVTESEYNQDITPVVGIEKTSLLVIQIPHRNNNTLQLKLIPLGGAVTVNSITLNVPTGVEVKEANDNKITGIGTFSTQKTLWLHIDTTSAPKGAIEVGVKDIDIDSTFTLWGSPFKKYIGTPSSIEIDGCFEDWNTLVGVNKFNTTATGNVKNANIDLYHYAKYTKGGTYYFYASVTGSMLEGNIAPVMKKAGTPHWGNTTPTSKPASPFDYAEITFTTAKHGTHTITVLGYEGKVIEVKFDGVPTKEIKVAVGKNSEKSDTMYGALELGMSTHYNITSYSVKMTDWNGASDVTPVVKDRSAPAPYAPEFDPAMLSAMIIILAIPVILRRKKD